MESSGRPSNLLFRLATAAAFASSTTMRVCDPMLPALSDEFSVSLAAVAPVIGLFALAYGIMQLVLGPLGERYGYYRVAAWSAILSGLACLACAAAPGLNTLLAGRVLAGATTAGIIPVLFAWIGERVSYEQRQVSIARVVAGVTLGTVAGQALGGIMVDTIGWRWAFASQTLLFVIPGVLMLRQPEQAPVLADAGMPATPAAPWRFATAMTHMLTSYRALLAVPWTRRILITVGLEGMFFYSALALLPAALHHWFDIALWKAGLVASVFGLGGFIYASFAPRLLGRFGEVGLVRIGWIGTSAGLVAITLVPVWPLAALLCFGMGVVFYCQHNTLQTHGTQMDPQRRGTAMAGFASIFFVGQAVGVALASSMVQTIGFNMVFLILAVALAALGVNLQRALEQRQRGSHALGRSTGKL